MTITDNTNTVTLPLKTKDFFYSHFVQTKIKQNLETVRTVRCCENRFEEPPPPIRNNPRIFFAETVCTIFQICSQRFQRKCLQYPQNILSIFKTAADWRNILNIMFPQGVLFFSVSNRILVYHKSISPKNANNYSVLSCFYR